MAADQMKRPALGQMASLGTLYDARKDRFLPHSALAGGFDDRLVTRENLGPKQYTAISNGTFMDGFDKMDIPCELGASLLANFVKLQGSARYLLTPAQDTALTVHRALHYTFTTCQENLQFAGQGLRDHLTLDDIPDNASATHIVSGITWGARCIIAATEKLPHEADRFQVAQEIEWALEEWEERNEWEDDHSATTFPSQRPKRVGEITVHSDLPREDNYAPDDMQSAHYHMMQVPQLVQESEDGKGLPLSYTLVPISFLSMLIGQNIPAAVPLAALSPECQERFVTLIDDLRLSCGMLGDYKRLVDEHSDCVSRDHMRAVSRLVRGTQEAEENLRSEYAALLKDIRMGSASSRDMRQLIDATVARECTERTVHDLAKEYSQRFSLSDMVTSRGGVYVGYEGQSRTAFDKTYQEDSWADCYVFYFDDATMEDTVSWQEHIKLLTDLLDDEKSFNQTMARRRTWILAVDCTATGIPIDELSIWKYQNSTLVTTNLVKQRTYLANKCLMRHKLSTLESSYKDKPWPASRKMVKIHCPGQGPQCRQDHFWICYNCHVPVEYGTDDNYMYCDCGRALCEEGNFLFDCQKPGHTPQWAQYRQNGLRKTMRDLEAPPEVNILILGESGVGKSTFINAFINYLTFESLDHALGAPDLNWIIPCSFGLSTPDPVTGLFKQRVVQIGPPSTDEKNGVRGQSATQKATAYPVYFDGNLVRLIDTPGIADTRGLEQDKENMRQTLSVLKNYTAVHGIMILLKPTSARLGVMFQFCINELLAHLHRDATRNIVFGFTNTRSSMFTPGDAMGPLTKQIEKYGETMSPLHRNTVYCFDSESFRYLAAQKQEGDPDIGDLNDYRRSWVQSSNESQRLIQYLEGRTPHSLKNTVGLAETRDLIARLVEPMAYMIRTVSKSIEDSKAQLKTLTTTKKNGVELRSMVHLPKTTFTMQELEKPYTVCNHEDCCTFKKDHEGRPYEIRKSLCHDPCYLTELETGKAGVDGIAGCAALRNGICSRCTHTPKYHLHVKFLYHEKTETTKDPVVQAKLEANASDVMIKQAGLDALRRQIAEFELEKAMIEDAQAKFSWYLEKNSITVYNNVTLEYLDHQIRDEKANMRNNDPRRAAIIEALEKSKRKHEAFVNAMREGKLAQGGTRQHTLDANGVERLIDALCAMRHFGKQFRDARHAVQNAYLKQFREKPFRVRKAEPYMAGFSYHSSKQSQQRAQNRHRSEASDPSQAPPTPKPVQSLLPDNEPGILPKPEITPVDVDWPVQNIPDGKSGKKSASAPQEENPEDGPPPYTSISLIPNWERPRRASLANVVRKTKRFMSRLKLS